MTHRTTSSANHDDQPAAPQSKRSWVRFVLLGLLLAAIVWVVIWMRTPNIDELMSRGETAFSKGHFPAARMIADRVLAYDPNFQRALLLKGRSDAKMGRDAKAIELLNRVVDDGSDTAVSARCAAGDLYLLQRKELAEAEEQYRSAIEQDPGNLHAHEQLAYVLTLSSRNWESISHRLVLLREGSATIHQLYGLSLGERALENPETVVEFHRAHPDDLNAQVGRARVDTEVKQYDQAIEILRRVVATSPEFSEAQVRLGKALELAGRDEALSQWRRELPDSVQEHPGVWFVWGTTLKRNGNLRVAARCFWEALKREAADAQSHYQLGQLLNSLDRSEEAALFLSRAAQLEAYVKSAELAFNTREPASLRRTSELAEKCGLQFEAVGWAEIAKQDSPGEGEWANRTIARLRPQLSQLPLTRMIAAANPALSINLSEFPLPNWKDSGRIPSESTESRPPLATVRFEDHASEVGLRFQYFNAGEPTTKGLIKMYEVVGGGAAVLDFDRDGWPDIHFAQGCRWPVDGDQREFLDQLYRNSGDGQFENVTALAQLTESGFSHGATVGDFNSDGFPDLFINNIGRNRLFENNGDGTFSDVTARAGIKEEQYTVSSVMADFNGDALPDIYAVNYLSGDDLFTKVCGDSTGHMGSCLPHSFPAAQDQMYLNRGDGVFENVTAVAGLNVAGGKGLGVVAADFAGSGRLSLFVANDVAPNFLFVNETEHDGGRPQFRESGLVSGVALNFSGQHESSMGIAAGDSNGDGLIDLFVTNFDNETNTLYRQIADQSFEDVSTQAGFGSKRRSILGWGTQFLDGDLDGQLDLIVTNGHVNDIPNEQIPFQMEPQFFQNIGGGKFLESSPRSLGPFFEERYLGRGLARLDWNRDGREDVVISHLDAPAALLTNTTRGSGHWLAVRLVARNSARDAIGTAVTVVADRRTLVRQLTAGDGNQASNERRLVFGLGDEETIDRLEVRWPSGSTESFGQPHSETELLLIEGRGEPLVLPRR